MMTKHRQQTYFLSEGEDLQVGSGFSGKAFRERSFGGLMDPIVLLDHYTMTAPTFGAHPHAGLSAVSILFEDTIGKFRNRDSLGNDFDLEAGDLYWLKAGRGIVHDEFPQEGATVHGLQVFINLPKDDKNSQPESLHVQSIKMPRIKKQGVNVRVVLGHSNGIQGRDSPALPMTILEGQLSSKSIFEHDLDPGDHAWCYAISGSIELAFNGHKKVIEEGQALALSRDPGTRDCKLKICNKTSSSARFVLFNAQPLKEEFVHRGPFVMSTEKEIEEVERAYAEGKLGRIP